MQYTISVKNVMIVCSKRLASFSLVPSLKQLQLLEAMQKNESVNCDHTKPYTTRETVRDSVNASPVTCVHYVILVILLLTRLKNTSQELYIPEVTPQCTAPFPRYYRDIHPHPAGKPRFLSPSLLYYREACPRPRHLVDAYDTRHTPSS